MTVGLDNVSDAIRALAPFTHPDYVDVFSITTSTAAERSAEGWARAMLEHTPTGRSAPFLWRLLGLRLGPRPSLDHVQGWRLAARGPDWIRIEAKSWFISARAIVRVGEGEVSLALFLRYDRSIASIIWPPVSMLHRRAVPVMLHEAVEDQRFATR